jgi:hypothetical protein
MSEPRNKALKAFEALRADVEQFDDHPQPEGSSLFSDKVPLYMKSYLVNWLRNFVRDHGDDVQNALKSEKQTQARYETVRASCWSGGADCIR